MPQVTGATHEVGVDQLFFSTTDARGVIRHSNNVFIELSRYRRDELSGAPHNIIRHPEMPGGAFKAMWDTLKTGSPFAAYVRNLAADGSEYDVFATVTPLSAGGALSVRALGRCAPTCSTPPAPSTAMPAPSRTRPSVPGPIVGQRLSRGSVASLSC